MQNLKKHNVSLKLNSAEFSELERICTTLGFSKADYLRAVAFGAPAPGATPTPAAETAPAPDFSFLQADIAALKTQQEEMNAAQALAYYPGRGGVERRMERICTNNCFCDFKTLLAKQFDQCRYFQIGNRCRY